MKNLSVTFSTTFTALTLVFATSLSAESTTVTYYHSDILGSPAAVTDENGNLLWRQHYKPFGETIIDDETDNDIGYAGHKKDADTGLTYMQARYYDPVVGRFMGMDPISFVESRPSSFNRYAYANNNPYAYVDPDGEFHIRAYGPPGNNGSNTFTFDMINGALSESINTAAGSVIGRVSKTLKYVPYAEKAANLVPEKVSPLHPIRQANELAKLGNQFSEALGKQAGSSGMTVGVSRDFIEDKMSRWENKDSDAFKSWNNKFEELYGMTFREALDEAENNIKEATDTTLDVVPEI